MRKIVLTAFIAGTIGFVAGNIFWYLASPLWIDRVVSEELPEELQVTVLARGAFQDVDFAHKGQGTATILETAGGSYLIRLTDFEVTNGPDLKVWLVKAAQIRSSADVKASQWVSLGPLKGNIGNQTYTIPENVNPIDYQSIVIWCEQFGVLFSPADMEKI